jgi:hypothetical protein
MKVSPTFNISELRLFESMQNDKSIGLSQNMIEFGCSVVKLIDGDFKELMLSKGTAL